MKPKKVPMRRCVGCMESKPKKELIRIVCTPQEQLKVDPTGKANGRGVYLCPNAECLEKAKKKKAIGRGLKISLSEEQLLGLLEEFKTYEGKDS